MIQYSTICAPREPCLCECTWLHLVSYPARWSFSFILGPLQSSSIYFQHPENTDIYCSSFVHGCTLMICVSYLQVDTGAECDQRQCNDHLAQCLWDEAGSPIVVSANTHKYRKRKCRLLEMQIRRAWSCVQWPLVGSLVVAGGSNFPSKAARCALPRLNRTSSFQPPD